MTTYRGNYARTGWYAAAAALTAAVAARFARLWQSVPLAGSVYAQPLVAAGVQVGGRRRDLVLVATSADDIYALDAATGSRVWGPVSIGTPVPRSLLACGDINPVGIVSTPALDPTTGTLYAVGLTRVGSAGMRYVLAAIDVATGAERAGFPVAVTPPASGGHTFNVRYQQQRAALTLQDGTVYVPFGGYYGDCGPYRGWVAAIPIQSPSSQSAFAVPSGREAGIWSAAGLSTAPDGALFAATGNGSSPARYDFGDSVLRLQTSPRLGFVSANRANYFAPSNFAQLNANDADLASSTPVVLPPQSGTSTPHLLFVTGKQGVGYLLNRDNLGGLSAGNGMSGEGVYSACLFGPCATQRHGSFATAAYWDGGTAGHLVFAAGDGAQPAPCRARGGVVALRLATAPGGASDFAVAWCSAGMGDPGSPAVSGPAGGNAVVWVVDTAAGRLYALAARDGRTLFSAPVGAVERFIAPAISRGRVFVGTRRGVVAFAAR